MTAQRFRLTPDRLDLAREFRGQPFGLHSLELQAALDQMRALHPDGKIILVCTELNRCWRLAVLRGDPLRPQWMDGRTFSRIEDAEWAVFRLRWAWLTGDELPADGESPPA